MKIETVTAENIAEVLPLIAAYQEFYGAVPDAERNRRHFGQLLEDRSRGVQFLARDDDGLPLGMATIYFTLSSVRACEQCLMNDLYVVPTARGQGVGRRLIEHCQAYARERGYEAIVWTTAAGNATAQRLYNSLPTERSAWLHYRLPT
jgi:GNAT superfamily N-acetyltransferase